ncbi:hypothetical protein FRC16_005110, partial [Serendipita sp. 398]
MYESRRSSMNEGDKATNEKHEFVHRDDATTHLSSSDHATYTNDYPNEKHRRGGLETAQSKDLQLMNAKIANPLLGKSKAEIIADVEAWTKEHGMTDMVDTFRKGALVAANPAGFEDIEELTEEDKNTLRREVTHKWHQPK